MKQKRTRAGGNGTLTINFKDRSYGNHTVGYFQTRILMSDRPADVIDYLNKNNATDDERYTVWKRCLSGKSFKINHAQWKENGVYMDELSALRLAQDLFYHRVPIDRLQKLILENELLKHYAPDDGDIDAGNGGSQV